MVSSGRPLVAAIFRAAGSAVALAWLAAMVPALPARAIDRHWNAASGAWGSSANWSPAGVPGTNDIVYVDYFNNGAPGSAGVSADEPDPVSIHILNGDTVGISTFGSLGVAGDFIVGYQNTHGTLNVTSTMPGVVAYFGQVTVGNTMRIGMYSGVGTVTQNDGTVTVNQLVRVGDRNDPGSAFTAVGTYNLRGYGVLNAARLEIGYGGDQGENPLIQGTFNLAGNAVLNISLQAQIPDPKIGGGGGLGVLNQTGGLLNSPNRIIDMAPGGGSGIYNFSGGTTSIAGISFSNANAGTINYLGGANLALGQLQMTGGGHVLLSSGHNKTLRASLLWMANDSAVIDLNDNAMVAGSVLETLGGQPLRTLIWRGYNGGAWTGNGLTSSAARIDPQHRTGLGYGLASEVLVPTGGVYQFNGQTVSGNASIIKYTYFGDTNLDGQVDVVDLGNLATAWQAGGSWVNGDSNYDGTVDVIDLGLLASNWQAGVTSPAEPASLAQALAAVGLPADPVPEPALTALLFGALLLGRRPGRGALASWPRPARRAARYWP